MRIFVSKDKNAYVPHIWSQVLEKKNWKIPNPNGRDQGNFITRTHDPSKKETKTDKQKSYQTVV